jgi:DNA-directed RNA polymerase
LYAHVAQRVQAEVDRSTDDEARAWKDGRVTRRVVKGPCMTYAYAVSPQGMAGQIEAALRELDARLAAAGGPSYLAEGGNRTAANWLAKVVRRVIAEEVPAARRALDWLKKAVEPVSAADLPVIWNSPLGLPVVQSYKKTQGRSVEVTIHGQRVQLHLRYDLEASPERPDVRVIDGRQAAGSIAANFIHSLDAAHLMMAANACAEQGITDLTVIHDSFGTHAANTDGLVDTLRATFVELYRDDPLAQFRAAILTQLPKGAKVPELPAYGDFDLERVRGATYMFA